jgi:hypothetical protein
MASSPGLRRMPWAMTSTNGEWLGVSSVFIILLPACMQHVNCCRPTCSHATCRDVWISPSDGSSPLVQVAVPSACVAGLSNSSWRPATFSNDLLCNHPIALHSCPSYMQGLKELEQRTGDGRIHLRFTFKRGLHPFFPSAVQVLHTSP